MSPSSYFEKGPAVGLATGQTIIILSFAMSGLRYLGLDGADGVLSSSSGTPSENSTAQQARKIRNVHRTLAIVAGSVLCLSGYERGVLGASFTLDSPSAALATFATVAHDVSCCLGAIAALIFGDRLGRKRTIFLATIVIVLGITLQAGASDMVLLIIGRVIAGIGNGANTATAPIWHVEISTQHTKGKSAVKEMIANVSGFLVARLMIRVCGFLDSEAQWRLPVLLPVLLAGSILVLTLRLPESPRWLLSRGRDAEAKDVLVSLSQDGYNEREYGIIWTSAQEELAVGTSWSQLLSRDQAARRLILGVLLQLCQQLTGINALLYSLDVVLHQSIGFSESQSYHTALGLISIYVSSALGSLKFIESYGRRSLLMFGGAAQSAALLGIAFCTRINQGLTSSTIALTCMLMYATVFGFSWMSIPWVYPVEINSLCMRTKGVALANAMTWIIGFLSELTVSPGDNNLGYNTFLGYAILNACFIPLVYFLVIETAGRSLEEIDAWAENHPEWLVRKVNLNVPWRRESEVLDEESFGLSEEEEEDEEGSGEDSAGLSTIPEEEEMDVTPARGSG